jgi:chromosomal replication initiation ATPase DnaA
MEDIVRVVAWYYKVSEDDLLEREKGDRERRKMAVYLCKTLSGKNNSKVGKLFGITIQAVTNAVRDIKRRKEADSRLNKVILMLNNAVEEHNV